MLLFIFFFEGENFDTLEAGHTNQMKYEKKENLHIKNQGPNWKAQWARFGPWADSWWPLANGSIQDERIFFLTQMIVVKKIKSSLKCFMKICHNLLLKKFGQCWIHEITEYFPDVFVFFLASQWHMDVMVQGWGYLSPVQFKSQVSTQCAVRGGGQRHRAMHEITSLISFW